MVKSLPLSCGLTHALLPLLILGAASANAAPTTSGRAGLPDDARPIWIGEQRYQVSRGSWFVASESDGRYTPTPTPREVQMSGMDLFDVVAYPMQDQTLRLQQHDHGQCHRWAIDQSGFNPTTTLEPPSRLQAGTYRRALAACLVGHRYSVQ
ncbi:hypothetical protein [Kushneria marisflavi]|uniref:Uncharacterized protein n=1 Tax=Kushneria marisflavi TaxID=157779 RepID=A0A240ULV8_9GAMM|nr:hypothetical protein [Kushneria marisflavi]ART62063.1 hypothetical protein B9H00_02395 [Kushneria marisflavi]RKD87130.1 hypothetical protein C8D96_0588 [Kushneria marisflavi]